MIQEIVSGKAIALLFALLFFLKTIIEINGPNLVFLTFGIKHDIFEIQGVQQDGLKKIDKTIKRVLKWRNTYQLNK